MMAEEEGVSFERKGGKNVLKLFLAELRFKAKNNENQLVKNSDASTIFASPAEI